MKRVLFWIATVFGVGLFIVAAGLTWFYFNFKRSIEPTISLDQYKEIVKERAVWDQYAFLPRTIDFDAEKTAFFHQPGFLQGGDVICLRQKLPEAKIKSLLKELEHSGRQEAESLGSLGSWSCYPKYGMTKPSLKHQFEGVTALPKGFRIFLFKSDLEEIKKQSNHNFLAFTAVSPEEREVVYFAESW